MHTAIIERLYHVFRSGAKVSTDTRQIESGDIFFALKGERFNANDFAPQALAQGAALVVVEELCQDDLANNPKVLQVASSLKTLQALARHYRQDLAPKVIGVGGSNGKTTTKELLQAVLKQGYKTFATPGNFNNHIGVPLSLLQMPADTEMAIIELGANHEGEIAELCEIAQPDYGIITNIGKDHLEGFGSVEGVARANSELYYFLLKNRPEGSNVFVNTNEEALVRMSARLKSPITYPNAGNDYEAQLLSADLGLKVNTQEGEILQSQLFGAYNFANIATALCVGNFFGINPKSAREAIAQYQPNNKRSQIIRQGGATILLDAYNANPSSMQLALESFAQLKASPKMVILGDMNELGAISEEEHRQLGKQLAQSNIDLIVLHGEAVKAALADNPNAYYFPDKFSLHNWLQDRDLQGYHILIKASRGLKLESVLPFI